MEGMSPRQQEVYDYISWYRAKKGMCPSIEDVADGIGLASTTVATYVKALIDKGYVTNEYGTPRSLKVVELKIAV